MGADFIKVVNCIFTDKLHYTDLSIEDKENTFFIINRFFSKAYPKEAKLYNSKSTSKSAAMDLWFLFFRTQRSIPRWYWSKTPKNEEKKLSKNDIELLKKYLNLKNDDINYLYDNFKEHLEKELKKFKTIEKEDKL